MQRSELARLSNMLFMLCSELALETFNTLVGTSNMLVVLRAALPLIGTFRHAVNVMPLAPRTSQKGLALSADTADVCSR